jgi:hypothetical protein
MGPDSDPIATGSPAAVNRYKGFPSLGLRDVPTNSSARPIIFCDS